MMFILLLVMTLAYASAAPSEKNYYQRSNSIYINGVEIYTENNQTYCDSIVCPENTARCVVKIENDPKDFSQAIRSNKCFNANNEIIKENTIREPSNNQQVSTQISSSTLGSEESEQLQKHIDEVNNKVQQKIAEDMANLEKQMEQLNYQLSHMFD